MPKSRLVPVRVDESIYSRIEAISKQRSCNFSDAARTVIKSGLDVIEKNHDLIDGQKLIEFLHDILRYTIKIDSVIFEGIIKETIKDSEKISQIYKTVLADLESRGFKKPMLNRSTD